MGRRSFGSSNQNFVTLFTAHRRDHGTDQTSLLAAYSQLSRPSLTLADPGCCPWLALLLILRAPGWRGWQPRQTRHIALLTVNNCDQDR